MKSICLSFALLLFVASFADASDQSNGWRSLDVENTLLMQLESGDVVIELAPQFAPKHVGNIKTLVSEGYFDGSAIIRSQDNYVVQWGDPNFDNDKAKAQGQAEKQIEVEFFAEPEEIGFQKIESRDAYAREVGFVDGFPVASDGKQAWLAHCYAMVGVSRDVASNSGNGSGLYVVTGHAPRHLDKNVTLVGRVVKGIELLSSLPRGTGDLGFFETKGEHIEIKNIDLLNESDLAQTVSSLQIMRTQSDEFKQHVTSRTTRSDPWFLEPTGRIELCNVGVPSRVKESSD